MLYFRQMKIYNKIKYSYWFKKNENKYLIF